MWQKENQERVMSQKVTVESGSRGRRYLQGQMLTEGQVNSETELIVRFLGGRHCDLARAV